MEEIFQLAKQFHSSTDETEKHALMLQMKALDRRIKQKAILVNQFKKSLKNLG